MVVAGAMLSRPMDSHERVVGAQDSGVTAHPAASRPPHARLARRLGRSGLLAGLVFALATILSAAPAAAFSGVTGAPAAFVRNPAPWTGGVELYRASAFTTQPNTYTCVPTAVQIMLNLANGTSNHSTSQISSWYTWGRAHNAYRYATPGLDPVSWAGLLNSFGTNPYQDESFATFNDALRAAATSLRETNLPVGLLVDHAHHAWVMTGFAATADPLRSPFNITSVTVMGPLYPRQSGGYDPRPGTRFTPTQLARYMTYYTEAFPVRWSNDYVIVAPRG
jgi:hypothetical protein